jgi:hypothetical protein
MWFPNHAKNPHTPEIDRERVKERKKHKERERKKQIIRTNKRGRESVDVT